MLTKKALAAVVLCCVTQVAGAAGSWTQTSTGNDDSDGIEKATRTEYVVKNSITLIGGIYRSAFVKTIFAPPVPLGEGRYAVSTISDVLVNCNDLSWGNTSTMTFDADMVPLMTTVGEYDRTKKIWTLKDMKRLEPGETTYKTGQFICAMSIKQ